MSETKSFVRFWTSEYDFSVVYNAGLVLSKSKQFNLIKIQFFFNYSSMVINNFQKFIKILLAIFAGFGLYRDPYLFSNISSIELFIFVCFYTIYKNSVIVKRKFVFDTEELKLKK